MQFRYLLKTLLIFYWFNTSGQDYDNSKLEEMSIYHLDYIRNVEEYLNNQGNPIILDNLMKIKLEQIDSNSQVVKCYYINDSLYSVTQLKNFKPNGYSLTYYSNGNILSYAYFKESLLVLPFLRYHKNSVIKQIGNVQGNSGFNLYYNENGTLIEEQIYLDSTDYGFIQKFYYENGKVSEEWIQNCGIQPYKKYYTDGGLFIEGHIHDYPPKIVGKWTVYYENGNKMMELPWRKAYPYQICEGNYKFWDEKRNLIKEIIMKEDCTIKKKIKYKESNQRFYPLDEKIFPFDSFSDEMIKEYFYW